MKIRLISLFLALLMLCGCSAPADISTQPEQSPDEQTPVAASTQSSQEESALEQTPDASADEPEEDVDDCSDMYHGGDVKQYLREHLPVMDGSTSLIALEAGVRSALFDITLEEAELQVSHSTTWDAFYNLLDCTNDLIFSVPLSQQQYEQAAEAGVTLICEPVAKEGFVFVVNAKNPVDSLTQQQLRDIYSGKITNWSEVGGNDMPIVAYQRNRTSGSQNYMIEFMGETELMEAPSELRSGSMGELMDDVAVNDNSEGAIGYSVYAYAADMYGNGNEIKFIQVDGVAPSKAAFVTGEYPLTGTNYAIYRDTAPENGPVRTLVSWLTSYEGQLACAKAGYVTLEDIGFDYEEMQLSNYAGIGCGGEAPTEQLTYEYTMWQQYEVKLGSTSSIDYHDYLDLSVIGSEKDRPYVEVTQLADASLQAEVNDFLTQSISEFYELFDEYKQFLILANKPYIYKRFNYDGRERYQAMQLQEQITHKYDTRPLPIYIRVSAQNGYLSVAASLGYNDQLFSRQRQYVTRTAVWDLFTGKRLSAEELFYDNTDVAAVLNQLVLDYINTPIISNGFSDLEEPMKAAFAGLSGSWWHLTADTLYIDLDNPFFQHGLQISLSSLDDDVLVVRKTRDFSDYFSNEDVFVSPEFKRGHYDGSCEQMHDGAINCYLIADDAFPMARRINAAVKDFIQNYYSPELFAAYFQSIGIDAQPEDYSFFMYNIFSMGSYGRYIVASGTPVDAVGNDGEVVYYPYQVVRIYDLYTGNQLVWTDLFKPGWQEHSIAADYDWGDTDPATLTGYSLYRINNEGNPDGLSLLLIDLSSGNTCNLKVESDYVNW